MRIALLESYYGGSHKDWADGYARHSRLDSPWMACWSQLTKPTT